VGAGSPAATLPRISPAEPVRTYPDATFAGGDGELYEEPPLPDEARDRAVAAAASTTTPREAGPGGVLNVRFATAAGTERLVGALEAVRSVLRSRPGATRVVIHLPQGTGRPPLPMELRSGVAYDAELPAEVRRRLGEGLVELDLATG